MKDKELYLNLKKQGYKDENLKHLLYNTCTDSSGHHYVRISKAYESPKIDQISEEEKRFIKHPLIKKFPLRFCIPKEPFSLTSRDKVFSEADPKVKHIVIMVNGLNEVARFNFKFYDYLSSKLAEKNIASVLLSTPYHLHRSERNTSTAHENILPHKKFADPLNFFIHYKITQAEIIDIAKRIKQLQPTDPYDNMFYENHFSKEVKITLLGYSMGGMISLGTLLYSTSDDFIKGENNLGNDNNDLIDTCVLYNTAPKLGNAITSDIGIDEDEWDDIWAKAESINIDGNNINNSLFSAYFKDLYVGLRSSNSKHSQIKKLIDRNKEKLLLVMSGADDIIDTKDWDDYLEFKNRKANGKGKIIINEFIFAGVGHSPMMEAQGAEVLPRIAEIMSDHILNNKMAHWQEHDIIDKMYEILVNTDYLKRVKKGDERSYNEESFDRESMEVFLEELGDNIKLKSDFLRLYYLSKIYFPKFYLLVNKILKKQSRSER